MFESSISVNSVEEFVYIRISPHEDKYFRLGKNLPIEEWVKVLLMLARNLDVFAWNPYDVLEEDPAFIMHQLNTDPLVPPKKQRSRRAAKPHNEAVKEEVEKLKGAGATKEVYFPESLANTVVVKKKNGYWRFCVDFTNLNWACPKDPFPVPTIDHLVDAMVGYQRMRFLDAF